MNAHSQVSDQENCDRSGYKKRSAAKKVKAEKDKKSAERKTAKKVEKEAEKKRGLLQKMADKLTGNNNA